MFEIYQKRQAYRLQIRSRQIKQLFAQARKKCLSELQSARTREATLQSQQNRQLKYKLMAMLSEMLNRTWQNKSSNRWVSILEDVNQFSGRVQMLRINNNMVCELLSLSIEDILIKNGENVLRLVRTEISEDECLGSTEEQQYYPEDPETDEHAHYKSQLERPNPLNKQSQRERNSQDRNNKRVQLEIIRACCDMLQRTNVRGMSEEGCIWMMRLLWGMLQQSADIYACLVRDQQTSEEANGQHRYTYMRIIATMLRTFNVCTSDSKAQNICWQALQELGVLSKVSELIDYCMEHDTLFKHQLAEEGGQSGMEQMHASITQIVVAYHRQCQDHIEAQQQQQSADVDINLREHLVAYGLYLLDTLSSVSQGSHWEMRMGATQMLVLVLRANTEVIASIQQTNYGRLVGLLHTQATFMAHFYEQKLSPRPGLGGAQQLTTTVIQVQKSIIMLLRLLQTICDSNQTVIYILVEQCHIVEIVYHLLCTTLNILKCSRTEIIPTLQKQAQPLLQQLIDFIIILLDTNKKSIKAILYTHKLWPHIFNYQSHYPLPSIPLFKLYLHYFLCFGKKVIFKHMHIFLDNVIKFDFNCYYQPGIEQIRKAIRNVYQACQTYLNQIQMEEIYARFQSYGLADLISRNQ